MPAIHPSKPLAKAKYLTFVVRCVLTDSGQIDHGEVIDTTDHTRQRFRGWRGLLVALQKRLQAHSPPPD